MVTQIHQKNPRANMDEWIDSVNEFNENFRSFILSGHLDHDLFDIDVVMQVKNTNIINIYKGG